MFLPYTPTRHSAHPDQRHAVHGGGPLELGGDPGESDQAKHPQPHHVLRRVLRVIPLLPGASVGVCVSVVVCL